MDFQLTAEQASLRARARTFARRVVLPQVAAYDRVPAFPWEIFHQARAEGLLHLCMPSAFAGAGSGLFEQTVVCEELSWSCSGICAALSLNALAISALLLAGNPAQQDAYFSRILAGQLCSFAVTEPGAGSDIAALQTTAILNPEGTAYILNGKKVWISNAPDASFLLILAKTTPEQGQRGMSLFLVERETPGLIIGPARHKLGQHALPAADVIMENAHIPRTALLGSQDHGFKLALQVFERSRPLVAAYAIGLTQRCLDEALVYARKRTSMGKPLIEHQAIGHKIAEMALRLEAARLLTYQAAWLIDGGQAGSLQASYAKAFAADTAMWAATETIQIFGSAGYDAELPIEKLLRDAKLLQIYEGTSEIQRLIIQKALATREISLDQ